MASARRLGRPGRIRRSRHRSRRPYHRRNRRRYARRRRGRPGRSRHSPEPRGRRGHTGCTGCRHPYSRQWPDGCCRGRGTPSLGSGPRPHPASRHSAKVWNQGRAPCHATAGRRPEAPSPSCGRFSRGGSRYGPPCPRLGCGCSSRRARARPRSRPCRRGSCRRRGSRRCRGSTDAGCRCRGGPRPARWSRPAAPRRSCRQG